MLPKSKLGFRTHDKPPLNSYIQAEYDQAITNLLQRYFQTHSNSYSSPTILQLSATAFEIWKEFQKTIERELRSDGKLINCLGWDGKICGFTLRIAGLLHLAEFDHGVSLINEDSMTNAVKLANLLTEHAIAAFTVTPATHLYAIRNHSSHAQQKTG